MSWCVSFINFLSLIPEEMVDVRFTLEIYHAGKSVEIPHKQVLILAGKYIISF